MVVSTCFNSLRHQIRVNGIRFSIQISETTTHVDSHPDSPRHPPPHPTPEDVAHGPCPARLEGAAAGDVGLGRSVVGLSNRPEVSKQLPGLRAWTIWERPTWRGRGHTCRSWTADWGRLGSGGLVEIPLDHAISSATSKAEHREQPPFTIATPIPTTWGNDLLSAWEVRAEKKMKRLSHVSGLWTLGVS